MDKRIWGDLEIGYLAGLLDGEGCFKLSKGQIIVEVTSTDKDIVERALGFSGVGSLYGPYGPTKGGKDVWRWQVGKHREVVRLLIAVLPCMSARRREKIDALADWLLANRPQAKTCLECGAVFLALDHLERRTRKSYCSATCRQTSRLRLCSEADERRKLRRQAARRALTPS